MLMKKRYIVILLALSIMCTCIFSACGKSEEDTSDVPSTTTSNMLYPNSMLMEGHVTLPEESSFDYSSCVDNEILLQYRYATIRERRKHSNVATWYGTELVFGFEINEQTVCENCGKHSDLRRSDCVDVDVANQIEKGMSLSQIYELMGNPHWGINMEALYPVFSSIKPDIDYNRDCSYYYVLSDGRVLIIWYTGEYNFVVDKFEFRNAEDAFDYFKESELNGEKE